MDSIDSNFVRKKQSNRIETFYYYYITVNLMNAFGDALTNSFI